MGKTTRRLLTAAVILFIFGISLLGWSLNELTKMRRMRRIRQYLPSFQQSQQFQDFHIQQFQAPENIAWWSRPQARPHWAGSAQSAGYLVPPEIWSTAIYEEENETKVIFIGPLGSRKWVDQHPKPNDKIYETNYRFYCVFGGEGNLKQAEIIVDKHHNTILITCSIPSEEMFYLNNLKYVMVSLFETTFDMQTQFIKIEQLSEKHHLLTACSMIKNEGRYLPEWIEYLKLMGVTKIVLYDNGSTDNVTGILEPYIKEETVTIISWKPNIPLNHSKYNPQIVALNDCLWRYRQFSRYQIHIDVDEFPYPLSHEIRDLLSLIEDIEHTNSEWHTLKLAMLYFGDAKVSEMKSKGEFPLVLESQLWRSKDVPNPLRLDHYKPIFKIEKVKAVSIHTATTAEGEEIVVDHKRLFRLNHYWRGERGKQPDLNKVYDEGTLQFVPHIKKQLELKNIKM